MCFPQNMGPHLSIDETSLSNGELYTIITNKAGHGRKGTLVAMLKGTRSEDICNLLLRHLPEGRRRGVRTITLDMAGSMARIARTCFPLAKQIIDRFHVQKEFKEALQDLRVQYRWQVMEDENRKMKEAKRQKLPYQPLILSNGDTLKQLLVRSRYLLLKIPKTGPPRKSSVPTFCLSIFMTLKSSITSPCSSVEFTLLRMKRMWQESKWHYGSTRLRNGNIHNLIPSSRLFPTTMKEY